MNDVSPPEPPAARGPADDDLASAAPTARAPIDTGEPTVVSRPGDSAVNTPDELAWSEDGPASQEYSYDAIVDGPPPWHKRPSVIFGAAAAAALLAAGGQRSVWLGTAMSRNRRRAPLPNPALRPPPRRVPAGP